MIEIAASITSSILFCIAFSWYIHDIWTGKVRLSVVTPFLLGCLGISQLISLISELVWYVVPFMVVSIILNITASIVGYRRGNFQIKTLDKFILFGGIVGIIVWQVSNVAAYNIYITTLIMLVAIYPAVRKTFKDPTSETRLPWLIGVLAGLVLLLTVSSLNPVEWLVPFRQLVFAGLMSFAVRNQAFFEK